MRDPRFDCDPLLRAAATARLSAALHSVKLRTAAAVVAAGQRSFATAILSDLAELDRANDSEFFVAPSTLPAVVEFAAPSPLARRVAIYVAAAAPDAPDADVPSLTGRAVAALGVELLDRRSPVDADRVARIVRDECGVSL